MDFKPYNKSDFEFEEEIGEGNFAKVQAVIHNGEKRALKIIDKKKLQKGDFKNTYKSRWLQVIKQEYSNTKLCESENTVKFYDAYESDDKIIFEMEKGDSNLMVVIKEKGKLPLEKTKKILNGLNIVFKKMDELDMIHRDIKPENMLVFYKNEEKNDYIVKLSDFGNARKYLTNDELTSVGTNFFMAPEFKVSNDDEENEEKEEKVVKPLVDIFSLGVSIYFMSTGKYPFEKNHKNLESFYNKYKENDDFVPDFEGITDGSLKDLLTQMLKINPKNRINWKNYFNHPFFTGKQVEMDSDNLFDFDIPVDIPENSKGFTGQ